MQGLTRKDKRLESLVDPIVDIMITCNIMLYCIHEAWVVGTGSKIFGGHMVFQQNQEGRFKGYKGKISGGVAIILSPAAIEA